MNAGRFLSERSVAKLVLWLICFLPAALAQSTATFPFQLDAAAEVVAEMELSANGADWGRAGREDPKKARR